jgi:hypothetical protein
MLLALVRPQLAYATNEGAYKYGLQTWESRSINVLQRHTKGMMRMKKKYHKMMLVAILILTAVIFCDQVAYGDTGKCANQNQPNLVGCQLDYMKSVGGFPPLFGKWTYLNYTATTLGGNISRDAMGIISGTDTPGTITFNNDGSLIQTAGDVVEPGAWSMSGKHMLVLAFADVQVKLYITKVSANHIDLTDSLGDTIQLTRPDKAGPS